MRLTIERFAIEIIAAAALLLFCFGATSAAFAAGKTGRSADGLAAHSASRKCLARRALRRDPAGNAAESSGRITAAAGCCRR